MSIQVSPDHWQVLGLSLLAFLLALAILFDGRQRRVPNQLVLVTLIFGILLHAFGPQAGARSGGLFALAPSALGIQGALKGALVAMALFLPFYILRMLGAGDVKLLAAVGSFAGPAAFVNLALFVLLAGGLLALTKITFARNARLVLHNTLALLGQMLPGSSEAFDARTQTAWRMPYAVAIASGVVAYGAWTLSGRAPILIF